MAYRIHFTVQDLARTRLAEGPRPLLELTTAISHLKTRSHPVRLGAWRRRAFAGLHPGARMVLDLVPARGWVPGFLSDADAGTPQELLERVRATPRAEVRASLRHAARYRVLPAWARRLPDDAQFLSRLWDSLDHTCDHLLAPHWEQIRRWTAADRPLRARQVTTGGVEALLAAVNPPYVHWAAPVLDVTLASGRDDDLHLDGRGLLLVPSVFGLDTPCVSPDSHPQPVLTYPVRPSGQRGSVDAAPLFGDTGTGPGPAATLGSLLGHTRAAVLATVAGHPGCSTTEIAARLGIAKASASEHATTLRRAGLVETTRHRNAALHSPTPLGLGLLDGHDPAAAPTPPPASSGPSPASHPTR